MLLFNIVSMLSHDLSPKMLSPSGTVHLGLTLVLFTGPDIPTDI